MVSRIGSVMVRMDRTMTTSYRLSIVILSLSAAVWPQVLVKSFNPEIVTDRVKVTINYHH